MRALKFREDLKLYSKRGVEFNIKAGTILNESMYNNHEGTYYCLQVDRVPAWLELGKDLSKLGVVEFSYVTKEEYSNMLKTYNLLNDNVYAWLRVNGLSKEPNAVECVFEDDKVCVEYSDGYYDLRKSVTIDIKDVADMESRIKFNCRICSNYRPEEIGDSDYGAVYSKVSTCCLDYDLDPDTEEIFKDFSYDKERDCCSPCFFKIADIDPEIDKLFREDAEDTDDLYESRAYLKFKKKYLKPKE